MRANRYLHVAVIGVTLLFFLILCQTAAAGPPKKLGNRGLPRCLAKVWKLKYRVWKLKYIVANQQETIDQQEERIEELEGMLQNFAAIPQTGQKSCWDEYGDLIDCEGTGQDGELQKGVQWPDPRFTDHGDGTVKDNLTGLIWLKDANCFGRLNWWGALDASNNLATGECGLNDDSVPGDWHLPNIWELYSLIYFGTEPDRPSLPPGHPFSGVQISSHYWSGTTDPAYPSFAYVLCPDWFCEKENSKDEDRFMWPVRGGN